MSIKTWGGKSDFEYDGCAMLGVRIHYGNQKPIVVSKADFKKLCAAFLGGVIKVGASKTVAPVGSLGEWLQNNVTKTAIASYVAPILVREGYAIKESSTEIRVIR